MEKYYRVKKGNFLWEEGAILKLNPELGSSGGYFPIEDIWNKTPVNGGEYISASIIEHENNADSFERVYSDDLNKMIFKTKEQLKEVFNKFKK